MRDGRVSVMIVDDNRAAIEVLASALRRDFGPMVNIVATTMTAGEAEVLIDLHRPDLLFLDVELPDASGVEYAAELNRRTAGNMKIVLYTSYEKYLIGALRASAFDFLLKPVVGSELATVMARYFSSRSSMPVTDPEPAVSIDSCARRLMITTATNDKLVLGPDDVGLFRYLSERKRWQIVLLSMKSHLLFAQTRAEDIQAYAPQYARINKTTIINLNYLAIIQDNECVMMPPFDKVDDLRISRNYRKELTDRFYAL